ncbi:mitofusin, partial [Kappamyces sp. JEL0680]
IWNDSTTPDSDTKKRWEHLETLLPSPQTQSLLHNGLVDISIIDSPGLNIDSVKTTALFSKQEEIDVVVFAKEFLSSATKDKAFVFIVVNRFDNIQKKDRNRENILEQIKAISASTFDDADNLVHFVSTRNAFQYFVHGAPPAEPHWITDFEKLEDRLRSFILHKRGISKLAPAKVYLSNLLCDLKAILARNIERQQNDHALVEKTLQESLTVFRRLKDVKKSCFGAIDKEIEDIEELISIHTQNTLNGFLQGGGCR